MIRVLATAAAMLALAACADRAKAPAGAPADTSAASPNTVNPDPRAAAPAGPSSTTASPRLQAVPPSGESLPEVPPITSTDQEDKSMPPGPVNPTPKR
jgi:hypothetical protein